MPSPQDKGYFLEFNESFLLAARTVSSGRPLAIEELREAPLDNKSAVEQALGAVFSGTGAPTSNVICSLRPRNRFFILATEKDTPKFPSLAAIRALAANSPFASAGPSELIGVDARSGLPIDGKAGSRWFVAGAPKESLDGMRTTLGEWKIAPSRLVAATVGLLGVILTEQQRAKAGPVLVWELGESTSDLFLVSAQGLEAVKRLPFGLDRVADGVQAELNLKFRGAATKLFFNELFDFSEIGPRIAARVTGSLQPAIAEISSAGSAPAALLCTGLVSRQNWFTQQMAKSVGLAPWQPDVTAWCTSAGLTFAGSTLQAKVTPTWLGLLGVMGAVQADRADADSVWCPAWTVDGVEKEVKPRAPEVVVPPPAPAAPVRPAAAPAAPAPKIIPPTPAAFAASSTARSPAPAAQPKAPAPVAAKPQTASNSPAAKPERELPTRAATPAPAPAPKAPAAPVRPAPVPLSAATSELASAAQRPPAPKARPADEQPAAPRSFFKTPAGFAVIGALVVAIGLSVFFYNQSATEKSAALAAKAQAEQRAATEAEALRKAQQQAQIEADARKRAENEIAQKNAAAEVAQKRATEEAKRLVDETNRLLNGRGSLVIVTEPAGATIALSNFAPRVSPATIKDLRLGHYSVNITLPGYDPVNLDVEIKDNATTDPGVIRMVGQFGSIELTTDPADVAYEIRPAGLRISLGGSEIRQGKTPATVGDLPIGDYVVTFKREGWPNHTENVSVERSKSAHVSTKFSGGTVTISSTPAGARVALNGNPLGQTPLTLNDVQPGEVTYSLDLPGFLSTTVTGQVEAEKPLNLNGLLRAQDRIVTPRELDTQPQAIKRVQPNLDREMTDQGGSATISLTVDRDGTTKDLKVETASDPEFGRRCLAAAAQWRFKPGTINGEPVRTRVMLPFKL